MGSTGVWTNNWRGIKNSMMLGGVYSAGVTSIYDTDGNLGRCVNAITSPLAPLNRGANPSGGSNAVRFGTSDTPAAATDFYLSNAWISNISYVSASSGQLFKSGEATFYRDYEVTVLNTSDATVNVREFGIFAYLNSSGYYTMLYRAVLDDPVAVAANETATITFRVTLTLADPVPAAS